ncbi:hypothetical protein GR217_34320 [Rhizobium leguminosarum]|uniref:Uncharacterized protein n=1 Tax=Rhizobium ruizarguesonis TaxID=2081791 RepID=A0AAE4YX95_9HYPH|nr:hypothetical protein [Rhizobium ruizarguesonis]NEI52696.1 hypothetical protein [Rhizobium ruizarguesonis]
MIAAVAGKPIKANTPMITVRKMTPTTERQAPQPRTTYKYSAAEIEAAIIADLKAHGPSRSADIGKRVAEFTEGLNKRLWSALYQMKKEKTLQADDNKRYFLVAAEGASEAQAAA